MIIKDKNCLVFLIVSPGTSKSVYPGSLLDVTVSKAFIFLHLSLRVLSLASAQLHTRL